MYSTLQNKLSISLSFYGLFFNMKTANERRRSDSQSKTDACNRNNAAKFCLHGCCHHSYRCDLSQAMKAMPSVSVKRYRHMHYYACASTLAVATHQQTSQPLYKATTKARGPDG